MIGKVVEESKPRGAEDEGEGIPLQLVFIGLLFLVTAGLLLIEAYGEFCLYSGEIFHKVFVMAWGLLAVFFFISGIGLWKKRKFALISGSLLLLLNAIIALLFTFYTPIALLGFLIALFLVYLLWRAHSRFKPFTKLDKWILAGMVISIILYVVTLAYASILPTPEEYYQMVSKEAREKGDITICDKLTTNRDYCIRDFAVSKNDDSLCEKIEWGHLRSYCYDDIHENKMRIMYDEISQAINETNISICWKLDGDWRDKCIKNFAYHTHDPSLCNNISSEYIRFYCRPKDANNENKE